MSYFIHSKISNLSNILSTESISPPALYSGRTMGFRAFDALEDDKPEVIRLAKTMPDLIGVGEEAATMAIEIPENLAPGSVSGEHGEFWTTETIYLSPTRGVAIHFADEQTLNAAFNSTRMSEEAKFADRYKKRARAAKGAKSVRPQTEQALFEVRELEDESVETRGRAYGTRLAELEMADRLKGALFCYEMADQLAVPAKRREDYVRFVQTVDEYVNATTQGNGPDQEERIRLMEGILYKCIIEKESERISKADATVCFSLVDSLREIESSCAIVPPTQKHMDSASLEGFRLSMESRIREAAGKRKRTQGRPEVCEIEGRPLISLPGDEALADHLLNELIRTNHYLNAGRDIRYPFARECGKTIRRYFGDGWSTCPERGFVNRLLTHLNEYTEFDASDSNGIKDSKNHETLMSLAYFCERLDNRNLGDFYRFLLIKCGITDFRLPFGIWGAVFGFSGIPKTFVDNLDETTERHIRKNVEKALSAIASHRNQETEEP